MTTPRRASARSARGPAAFLLSAALLSACGTHDGDAAHEVGPGARHLVLISLDTVRADRLGCYGHGAARTPRIDALGAEGVVFDAAVAAAPTTLASHASLLTGQPPHRHGVPRNGFVLSGENVTLAESLSGAGFRTLAAVGARPLDHAFGLDQGFDRYDDELGPRVRERGYAERPAEAVTDAALDLVDGARADGDEPRLFLFVHYFDAHAPYVPPPEFRTAAGPVPSTLDAGVVRAADDHYERLTGERPGRSVNASGLPAAIVDAGGGGATALDRRLAELYDDELAALDTQVGRLLDGLDERGLLGDAAILLTADHGETMWEHADFWNHGLALHDTTVRVPLVVRAPGGAAGRRVGVPVSGIDVARTALGLLGLEGPGAIGGVDLGPLLEGGPDFVRGPVFSEATLPFAAEEGRAGGWWNATKPRAVRDGRWKYVRWGYNGHEQLFDLDTDPGETTNLLASGAEGARGRADRLAAVLADWAAEAAPLESEPLGAGAGGTRRDLEALGYGRGGR